jgi:phosphoserine phosphatase
MWVMTRGVCGNGPARVNARAATKVSLPTSGDADELAGVETMSSETPLPSWRDGAARRALVEFVGSVTRMGGPGYVPPDARVAVFDNDGTLWCEKPLPIQADFLVRRLADLAERDPSLRARQPWKAAHDRDYAWLGDVITKHYRGDDADLKLMEVGLLQAYAGATVEEFEATAAAFLRSAQHPVLRRPYLACTYQPMVELLEYLKAAGFTSYIASGGGRDFIRPVAEELYGLSPDRVIGSSVALGYRDDGGVAVVVHKPELDIFDDGPAKPVQIWERVGRRPILAAGNSNGDIPMLHFSTQASRPSLKLLLEHDDAAREYAYQAGAEESLERARRHGWTMVSMKRDWTTVFTDATRRTARRDRAA